jgi:hypothetical protein
MATEQSKTVKRLSSVWATAVLFPVNIQHTKPMAAKTKNSNKPEIPRFTVERTATGAPIKAKIVVPRVSWEALPATLEKLIEKAQAAAEAGKTEYSTVKGVLSLY